MLLSVRFARLSRVVGRMGHAVNFGKLAQSRLIRRRSNHGRCHVALSGGPTLRNGHMSPDGAVRCDVR